MKNSRAAESNANSGRAASQLIDGCRHNIQQCDQLLGLLNQDSYTSQSVTTSSIGAHMRHILDRFHCLFAGIQSGVIDYDARKRDKSIESNLQSATFALTSVSRRIDTLDLDEILGRSVEVRESVHHESPLAEIPSTFDRELMGLISHSTHHLAIIALIAKSLGYEIDDDFGKASSTIVYERS